MKFKRSKDDDSSMSAVVDPKVHRVNVDPSVDVDSICMSAC